MAGDWGSFVGEDGGWVRMGLGFLLEEQWKKGPFLARENSQYFNLKKKKLLRCMGINSVIFDALAIRTVEI